MPREYFYALEDVLEEVASIGSISSLLGLASYVFCALSLYTIAQRREIRNPWLAWIPVVNVWILGSISDQYRYVVKGEVKAKRKVLLVAAILNVILSLAVSVRAIAVVISTVSGLMQGASQESMMRILFDGLGSSLLLSIPGMILSIVGLVFELMALYDVYTSCEPANNVLYLILSIIPGLSTITKPLFLFLSRDKDGGMPPRRKIESGY